MGIVMWILFGAIVGWIASLITKTKKKGLIKNIVVGLLGALLGGFIGSLLGIGSVDAFTLEGFLIAIAGAIVLLWLMRKFKL